MKKDDKVVIICGVLFALFVGYILIKSTQGISGKVMQVVDECGSDYPVLIMKSIGVKKINSIEKDYQGSSFKSWEVNVNDGLIIDLEKLDDSWSLMGKSYKKINEIDKNINSDDFAHYYSEIYDYLTNLDETKVLKASEVKKKVDKTKLTVFERFSGLEFMLFPLIAVFSVIFLIIYFIKKSDDNAKIKKDEYLSKNNASYVLKNIIYNFGIANFIQGNKCEIFIQDEKLKMVDISNQNVANILFSQITACDCFTDTKIQQHTVTKNGNVIGRGALGGFVFGPAGLILGGLSGVGAKTSTKNIRTDEYYLIINYKAKDSDEIKSISFKSPMNSYELKRFVLLVQEKIEKKDIDL